ncbi:uncharacterized protein LOC128205405 [Mya arenaria]|nr:uncharacterized protein LOC128205405 [Mya arenaria]
MERLGNSTLVNDNTFCQSCKGEGEIKDAHGYCQNCEEYMCQDCIKYVHRMSKNKGHNILTGEQMPSTPSERDDLGSPEKYSEMCKIHTNEALKFFCPDHEAFECGVCIVLHHRACSVQFVPDAAKGFSNTSEYKDQQHMLGAIQNDIKTCLDTIKEISVSANKVHSVALGDLKKFKEEINEYLDETERDIESSAEHLKAGVDEKIEELNKKYVEIKGRSDKSEQTLDISSSDEVRLFMTSKRSGKAIEDLKLSVDNLKKTCQEDNIRYGFKRDSVFEKILNLKRNMGKMTVTNETENDAERYVSEDELYLNEDENDQREGDLIASEKTSFGPVGIEDITVISDDDIYPKTKGWCQNCKCYGCSGMYHTFKPRITSKERLQFSSCHITGMAVLSSGRLVVADSKCHSVKVVDISKNKVLARYSTASYPTQGHTPFDVTVVSNEKIAVTYICTTDRKTWRSHDSVINTYTLSILSTENNTLAELYGIQIPTIGYISYINCRFFLSYGSSISVHDDKINDVQFRKFKIKGYCCSKPVYASDGNAYYITDTTSWGTYTLRKVSLNGNTLATYTDWEFKSPGFVTLAGDGNILLYNNDKQELLLMSGNCEKISVMKFKEEDWIKNIRAMSFCSETKTLFVSDGSCSKTIKAIKFTCM